LILQNDSRLRSEIRRFGCYFMDLLWHANRLKRVELDTDIIRQLYIEFVGKGWMHKDCYIKNPDSILGFFGLPVTTRKESRYYFCSPNEFEVLKYSVSLNHGTWNHFVAGDGFSHVTYDPYGVSRAVSEGMLIDKRIFRRNI